MTHYMNLKPQPFSMIRCGAKTYELRLLDEKRKLIQVGDLIVFKNTAKPESTLSVRVKGLHVFETFEQLYAALPLDKCGYTPDQVPYASAHDMDLYYSIEKQKQHGVIGIEIEFV